MTDPRDKLKGKFHETHRFANFGNMLSYMHIRGFRCHIDTVIEFQSPITAFCGLNGTGKSTILQLAAAAYRNSYTDTYNIRDFLIVSSLDPHPFSLDASVEYRFWQNVGKPDEPRRWQNLTLSRGDGRWSGYQRRPSRAIFFAGIGLYLPRIEQRDFIVRKANRLTIHGTEEVEATTQAWTCKILNQHYDSIDTKEVSFSRKQGSDRRAKVISVGRGGIAYSEAHMGYGEGRVQYLIRELETLPPRSLVLIEEPETSLHPSAQYRFGEYLMDVVLRKGHQVLLTTHSESLLKALPSASLSYLKRTENQVEAIAGLTPSQAQSLMTEGYEKALNILVEDNCAEAIIHEILLRCDPDFHRSVAVHPIGDAQTVRMVANKLQSSGLAVVAVLDADMEVKPQDKNVFKLPGSQPPEKELFHSQAIQQHVQSVYGVNLIDLLSGQLRGVDHHSWFKQLGNHINRDPEVLLGEVARIYARALPENDTVTLYQALKEATRS